jgi:hypothetical protein
MSGVDLPNNFIPNLEALLRKNRSRTSYFSATPLVTEPLAPVPATIVAMAQKSIRQFSILVLANVRTWPAINIGNKNFELRTELITMV